MPITGDQSSLLSTRMQQEALRVRTVYGLQDLTAVMDTEGNVTLYSGNQQDHASGRFALAEADFHSAYDAYRAQVLSSPNSGGSGGSSGGGTGGGGGGGVPPPPPPPPPPGGVGGAAGGGTATGAPPPARPAIPTYSITPSGASPVLAIAAASQRVSGPLEVGVAGGDKHQLGTTEDGEVINSGHLSTGSYFFLDPVHDAPLAFRGTMTRPPMGGYFIQSFIYYDAAAQHGHACGVKDGIWDVQSMCSAYCPPVENDKYLPGDHGPEPYPDPCKGWAPAGSPGAEPYGAMTYPFASAVQLARPQHLAAVRDLRVAARPWYPDLNAHDNTAPVTGREEAWGYQVGESWSYTYRPGSARYRGGTAIGGVAYLPPELSIDDYVNSYAPAGVTASTSYRCAVPGVYWAAGLPNPLTGGIKTGYRWATNASGELSFDLINSSGAVATAGVIYCDDAGLVGIGETNPQKRLDVAGEIRWEGAGVASGILTHDNSSDAIYDFPRVGGGVVVCAATQYSAVQVFNDATETSLLTGSIRGSMSPSPHFLEVGRVLRFKAAGIFSIDATDVIRTIKLTIYYGATAIATLTTAALTAGATNKAWEFEGVVTVYSVGGTGTLWSQAAFKTNDTAAHYTYSAATGTVTIDTTDGSSLDLKVQHGAAKASTSITITNFSLTVEN